MLLCLGTNTAYLETDNYSHVSMCERERERYIPVYTVSQWRGETQPLHTYTTRDYRTTGLILQDLYCRTYTTGLILLPGYIYTGKTNYWNKKSSHQGSVNGNVFMLQ